MFRRAFQGTHFEDQREFDPAVVAFSITVQGLTFTPLVRRIERN